MAGLNGNTGRVVLGVVLAGLLGEGSYTIHMISKHGERLARVEAKQNFLINHLTKHNYEGVYYGSGGNSSTGKTFDPRGGSDIEANPRGEQQIYSTNPDSLRVY